MNAHHEQHVRSRQQTRELGYAMETLAAIAHQYTEDTAVILGKRNEGAYTGMVYIVLIVRGGEPITVFTRRVTQNMDKRNFGVQKIAYL